MASPSTPLYSDSYDRPTNAHKCTNKIVIKCFQMCAFLVWLPLWSLYRQPLVKITPPEPPRIHQNTPKNSPRSSVETLMSKPSNLSDLVQRNFECWFRFWRYLSWQIKPIWSIWLTVAMMKNSSLSHLYCLMITCTVSGLTEMGYFHFTRNRQQETFCDKKETNFLWRAEFVGRKILETTFWHVSHWNPNLVDSSGINVLRLCVAHERYRVSHLDTPRWC